MQNLYQAPKSQEITRYIHNPDLYARSLGEPARSLLMQTLGSGGSQDLHTLNELTGSDVGTHKISAPGPLNS